MRKLTKVLVLVAAFTALFALTALAKTGWASDENGWYFVGTDGEWVKDAMKASNGKVYYLDEETGYMVTNKAVEYDSELYYFDETGARISDAWQLLPASDDDESGEANRWYYFLPSGKAFKAEGETWTRKYKGKTYGFDSEGRMLFGFVGSDKEMKNGDEDAILTANWVFGDNNDGAMITGWYLYDQGFSTIEKESAYFYLAAGGKYVGQTYLIKQKYYAFDDNGIMITGWDCATDSTASYYKEDGTVNKNSWVYTTAPSADGDANPSSFWYYLDANGKVKYYGENGNVTAFIKKKYYAFNEEGQMISGLSILGGEDIVKLPSYDGKAKSKWADVKEGSTNLYYFDKADNAAGGANGWALTGDVTIDFDDETVTLTFDKYTYKALHGEVKTQLYDHGQLQKASAKYALKKVDGKNYFVDGNGKLVTKAGRYGDSDGNYYVILEAGKLPKYKVAANEYAYKNAKGDVKYASAAEVAKMLANNTWDETYWPVDKFVIAY